MAGLTPMTAMDEHTRLALKAVQKMSLANSHLGKGDYVEAFHCARMSASLYQMAYEAALKSDYIDIPRLTLGKQEEM